MRMSIAEIYFLHYLNEGRETILGLPFSGDYRALLEAGKQSFVDQGLLDEHALDESLINQAYVLRQFVGAGRYVRVGSLYVAVIAGKQSCIVMSDYGDGTVLLQPVPKAHVILLVLNQARFLQYDAAAEASERQRVSDAELLALAENECVQVEYFRNGVRYYQAMWIDFYDRVFVYDIEHKLGQSLSGAAVRRDLAVWFEVE